MIKIVVEEQTYYKWWKMIDVNVIEYYKIWWFVIHNKIIIVVDVKICSFS